MGTGHLSTVPTEVMNTPPAHAPRSDAPSDLAPLGVTRAAADGLSTKKKDGLLSCPARFAAAAVQTDTEIPADIVE